MFLVLARPKPRLARHNVVNKPNPLRCNKDIREYDGKQKGITNQQ